MKYGDILRARYRGLVDEKAQRDRGEDPRSYIKTGLKDFDKRAGIERSILTVIGAPTGEGKSIFKKHLQEHAAQSGLRALDLSFEDPPERSADRTFSTLTDINNAKLAKGCDARELARVAMALADAEEWADSIDFHYGLRTPAECLTILEDSEWDLAQVDYAQAFPEGDKGLERTIADFAWKLNVLAQERKAAIVIYSQLNSKVETRGVERAESSRRYGDKGAGVDINGFRPFGVSDLAWSTALGQRAKGLGFLFRPNRYRRRYGENVRDDQMELIWPKANFNSEGSVVVGFDGKTARLFDLAEKEAG
jgi:replicative DNA helicase